MIVHDFDVLSTGIGPSETHSELIVDPDAVLSFPVAYKGFQTIPGWNAKVSQPTGNLKLTQLAAGYRGNIGKTLYRIASSQRFRVGTPKGFDHGLIITHCVINVKRCQNGCMSDFAFEARRAGRCQARP
jgi:hypothetical protein